MSYELGIPRGGRETFFTVWLYPELVGQCNTGFTCSWPRSNLIYILGLAADGWEAFDLLASPYHRLVGKVLTVGFICS